MLRLNNPELIGGTFIFLFGLVFFLGAQEYRMGTAARMGPGFVPYYLGLIQMGLGLMIIISSLSETRQMPSFDIRAMICIAASLAAFAYLLPRFGLIPAVCAQIGLAVIGNPNWKPKTLILLALGMSILCWVLFLMVLGLPMRAFRSPF